MDDKLLGEKVHYYCSSSEDEGEEDDERSGDEAQHQPANTAEVSSPEINDYSGHSTNVRTVLKLHTYSGACLLHNISNERTSFF